MANQDPAHWARNALLGRICVLRENEGKRVGNDVFWGGTYCSELEWGHFANLPRSSGSSRSLNQFVGSPFIQQKPHNYAAPIE